MPDAATQPDLAPVGRGSTRTDLVTEAIRSAIIEGRFEPGMTLVERRLADQLGVSKTPVREALIRLARSGLVDVTDNRGAVVRHLDGAALLEDYDVRLRLEPWAVERAVQNAPEQVHAEGLAALAAAGEAIERGERSQISLANRGFHRTLYARCGNEIVRDILDNLQDRVALGTVALLWSRQATWRTEGDEHRAILDAVGEADGAKAAALLNSHLVKARGKVPAA